MASEYAKYQQKLARKKATPEQSAKLVNDEKPLTVEPRKPPERKRH